jgi:hypothetical protein
MQETLGALRLISYTRCVVSTLLLIIMVKAYINFNNQGEVLWLQEYLER